jgi:hypothetical protein
MPRVSVWVENEADETLASVILAGQPVTIKNGMCESGAITRIAYALGQRPDLPAALLLGTREAVTPREKDAKRASLHRLVLGGGTMNYFIALAEPRVLDWALSDPRLRRAFEASPQDMRIYLDRAARVAELARSVPFDPSHLLQQSEDYRGLIEFIRKHARASAPSQAV